MCYYVSVKTNPRDIIKVLDAPFERQANFTPYNLISGFSHPELPVLSVDHGRSVNMYSWGLIPFWVKSWDQAVQLRRQTLNAKSETIFEKPSFRDSIVKRRCIIPVTGFFEWKHVGKDKIPYYIHPKTAPLLMLAGTYSLWTDPATKDTFSSFSIITKEADEFMADIHNTKKRMPLRIDSQNINSWISNDLPKSSVIELMNTVSNDELDAYTVSKDAGNAKAVRDVPEILNKVEWTT